MLLLTLPIPPSINAYYGAHGNRRYIKPAGLAFRRAVAEIVAAAGHPIFTGRVSLYAAIFPASKRVQDLDNRSKALQDALTHAGVWIDDSQIDQLTLARRCVIKGGKVQVVICEIPPGDSHERSGVNMPREAGIQQRACADGEICIVQAQGDDGASLQVPTLRNVACRNTSADQG